ncbi:MAG: dTMP kinase [Candidatus Kerfeldbacteria bacterium]
MKKGTFIVFEGGEGSGKTRHASALAEYLRNEGYDVLETHEPGGSEVGKVIRKAILYENKHSVFPRTELFLFLADRAQHVEEVIRPALEEGKVVLCDRFSGSTFAYQLGGRELRETELIQEMDAYARNGLDPDMVLYLDIDPETGIQRKEEGPEELNRMDKEELEFHKKVRVYFLKLAEENDNWEILSTDGPKEENEEKIIDLIMNQIKK